MLKRCVLPELLDDLPVNDPEAILSRGDLRRLNGWMGNASIVERALRTERGGDFPRRIVDIGAGDGQFLLSVARRISARSRSENRGGFQVTLLDRRPAWNRRTVEGFKGLGWRVDTIQADLFDWIESGNIPSEAVVVTNLFLHHFQNDRVSEVFNALERRVRLFVAVEPRRSQTPLFFSQCLLAIGCNRVTRHDAPVSVRAGFKDTELSELWPVKRGWQLTERQAGLFSHLFVARKRS